MDFIIDRTSAKREKLSKNEFKLVVKGLSNC